MTFESIVDVAKKQTESLKKFLDFERWTSKIAINDEGKVFFEPKTSGFIARLRQDPTKHFTYSYKETKIWLDQHNGNFVEFFFSFPGDTLLMEDSMEEMSIDIPIDEFVILKQILKIPDGFAQIYPLSILDVSESNSRWFSFRFNVRNGILVPLPT